jgi:hypothetical protein
LKHTSFSRHVQGGWEVWWKLHAGRPHQDALVAGASRRTFEHLEERVARRDLGIDIRTQKGATFYPKVQETRRRKGNLRVDEVKHLHLTLPFFVIFRSSSEENYKVRWVQENNVGNLKERLLGKLPRFQRLTITCSMQPYRLGQIRA